MSIEYHGTGVENLKISDRMTLANLASEMGAKNAVFPPDWVMKDFFNEEMEGVWADKDAVYSVEMNINLDEIPPLVAAPHHVDNIRALSEVAGTPVQQGLIGTCTNGRLEDLRMAAKYLSGKKIHPGFQLLVIPASVLIYQQAMKEGLINKLIDAGATILSSSCGPCLGTGQGIPADGITVISTANRNFKGRMGNPNSSIYLASPATVAVSALTGKISDPRVVAGSEVFVINRPESSVPEISEGENRRSEGIWNYIDMDNLNTDQMFAGNLTYSVLSSDGEAIMPHLFAGCDPSFSAGVKKGDILVAGDNFGCGSSREHPSVGLAYAGVKAVIVKSVNRIFYRSAINQGLPLIVHPELVNQYKQGDKLDISLKEGTITLNNKTFKFEPLPEKLMEILEKKGLVNWIRDKA